MNSYCDSCRDKPACVILNEEQCPRLIGTEKYPQEVPFCGLSTAIEIENFMQRSSDVFCGSDLRDIKRRTREEAPKVSGLKLKEMAAFELLGSTAYDFSIEEVCELLRVSRRSLFYWKSKLHPESG